MTRDDQRHSTKSVDQRHFTKSGMKTLGFASRVLGSYAFPGDEPVEVQHAQEAEQADGGVHRACAEGAGSRRTQGSGRSAAGAGRLRRL